MLLELQQEVEAVKWATAEEIKSKQSELERSREDARRLHTERDNALGLQRRDMTSAFEQLVSQREGAFTQREHEIVSQISMLEKRVEGAQTENGRLKAELSDVARQRDKMSLDVERKEEAVRQLQWKLDDSSEMWKKREDTLERGLSAALTEVNLCRDSLIKQIGDSQLDIDRV
jgi:chromosome segregation ATPase